MKDEAKGDRMDGRPEKDKGRYSSRIQDAGIRKADARKSLRCAARSEDGKEKKTHPDSSSALTYRSDRSRNSIMDQIWPVEGRSR